MGHSGVAEKFSMTRGDPTFTGTRLTFRAVLVAAGVGRDGAMSAAVHSFEMNAECGGATPRNASTLHMLSNGFSTDGLVRMNASPRDTDEIGQLEGWRLSIRFRCSSFSFSESRMAVECQLTLRKDGGRWWSLSRSLGHQQDMEIVRRFRARFQTVCVAKTVDAACAVDDFLKGGPLSCTFAGMVDRLGREGLSDTTV